MTSFMDRRDFFGVIAAPLLRRFVPPVPTATQLSGIDAALPGLVAAFAGACADIIDRDVLASYGEMDFAFASIIKDDLDALRDTPALFGRPARQIEERRAADLLG